MNEDNEDEILLFNCRNHVFWDVLVDCFNLSDDQQHEELNNALDGFKNFLVTKDIKYSDLRRLLFPGSTLFAFVVNSNYYGYENYATPLDTCALETLHKDKKSNAIFSMGDYLVEPRTAPVLKKLFKENGIDVSDWHDATQYYVLLVSGIAKNKATEISNQCERSILGYCGMIDLTLPSLIENISMQYDSAKVNQTWKKVII